MAASPRPATPATTGPAAFEAVVDGAITRRSSPRVAAAAAVAAGCDLRAVLRMAAGVAEGAEKRRAEMAIGRTTFAAQAAAAVVRGGRGDSYGGLAAGLLEGARQNRFDPLADVTRAAKRDPKVAELTTRISTLSNDPDLALAETLAWLCERGDRE